jgi:uncharacterized protein (TIGR02284 family)
MGERSERAILNHLIEICRDAERGFRVAAGEVDAPELQALFLKLASQRKTFADSLLPHSQRLGGERVGDGTNAAALHRAWMQIKARLAADRDHAVVDEAVRGERHAVAAYDDAVNDMLPPGTRDLVEAQDLDIHVAEQLVRSARA